MKKTAVAAVFALAGAGLVLPTGADAAVVRPWPGRDAGLRRIRDRSGAATSISRRSASRRKTRSARKFPSCRAARCTYRSEPGRPRCSEPGRPPGQHWPRPCGGCSSGPRHWSWPRRRLFTVVASGRPVIAAGIRSTSSCGAGITGRTTGPSSAASPSVRSSRRRPITPMRQSRRRRACAGSGPTRMRPRAIGTIASTPS